MGLVSKIATLPRDLRLVPFILNRVKREYYAASGSTLAAWPSTLNIEVTNECDSRCRLCPRASSYGEAMDKGSMSIENLYRLLDEITPHARTISLTGLGEPFKYGNLLDAIKYIRSKDGRVGIFLSTSSQVPGFADKVRDGQPRFSKTSGE